MRSVLHCELGPVPWSLATPDGGLVKTDKSCLLHLLESGTQPLEDVPPMAALILDGMAVLQTTRADNLVLVKFGFSALSVPRFFGV